MSEKPKQQTSDRKPVPDSPDRIGTAPVGKLLLEFSIPAMLSMLFNTLYNLVDTVFLGWAVGKVGVAVTTLAMPVMMVLIAFSVIAGQGGNALAAIQLGKGQKHRVEKTMGNTALLLVGLAVAVAGIGIFFIDHVLWLVGADPVTWDGAKVFIRIICIGFMFQSLGMGMNNFLRTMGKPNLALFTMGFGTFMCIIFNFLFVLHFGWGVEGSALATVLGQGCGMVPVLWFVLKSRRAPFHLKLSEMKPDLRLMGKILSLGMASFLANVAGMVVGIVMNQTLKHLGEESAIGAAGALAAVGIMFRVTTVAVMPMFGLVMGAQPIIGYNYGAKNWDRVLHTMRLALIWATVLAVGFFLTAVAVPNLLVAMFGVTGEVGKFAALSLRIGSACFFVVGVQIMGASYFQSSGQPTKASFLQLTRQVIFLIPLFMFIPYIAHDLFGMNPLHGFLLAFPLSDALSFLVTGSFVVYEWRKLKRLQAQDAAAEPDEEPATPASEKASEK